MEPWPRIRVHAESGRAYSLVVGLCVAITLASAPQRWAWLFPMPATRAGCPELGRYEGVKAEAALSTLASRDSITLAHAQEAQSHAAIADCLSATARRSPPRTG
ncbi:hypothetical protein [Streptomyces sp. NBC_01435]|uniref:hypothetical protein n=1 Tax=Streptomyces sp. NBC_01435 TaxID=2903865 RepID=UPI002E2F14B6|nr:hypothetical protein [Streptomyces sp. NBC_01435]